MWGTTLSASFLVSDGGVCVCVCVCACVRACVRAHVHACVHVFEREREREGGGGGGVRGRDKVMSVYTAI